MMRKNSDNGTPRWIVRVCVVLIIGVHSPLSEALVVGIPPVLPVDMTVFEAFATELNRSLGEQVTLERSDSWQGFQSLARSGKIDLVFAAPHFTAWLIRESDWSPLLRIEGEVHFLAVTRRAAEDIFEISDLVGRQVCAPLAPELGNLVLLDHFPNPNRQPLIRETQSGRGALASLDDSRCDAVVVIESIYNDSNPGQAGSLTLLMKSRAMGNYGFTSRLAPGPDRTRLMEALSGDQMRNVLRPLLLQYSNTDSLVPATTSDYQQDFSELMDGYWK